MSFSTYRTPPTLRSDAPSKSKLHAMLKKVFGPTARVRDYTECGVRGARVTVVENGQTFVLATCFSGCVEDRQALATLWALEPVMHQLMEAAGHGT